MRRQVADFLDGGRMPEDFRGHYPDERKESEFRGWVGEAGINEEGRRATGLLRL